MTIPVVEPADIAEVVAALEAAHVAWPDDPESALVWVRRAAQVAGQAGHDERALALALAATELAERQVRSDVVPVARQHDESATTAEIDVSAFGKRKNG